MFRIFSSMTFYRTYRPQTISQLDKPDVRDRLFAMVKSRNIPHALLFTGPRGTGKTSTARLVAKMLNCEKLAAGTSKDTEPCNQCDQCRAIASGTHLDVYEIDAASNRGIDEIRDLREKINLSCAMGKKKVYIVDEAHMLTREAFNALLKTLEEPPAHVHFILATTDDHKLPDTIKSRCTQIAFSKATVDEIVHGLNRVVSGESLTIDEGVLELIAQRSGGSFRDAVKLLEQAVSENALTLDILSAMLHSVSVDDRVLDMFAGKEAKALLAWIQELDQKGTDFSVVVSELLTRFHDVMLEQYGVSPQTGTEHDAIVKKFTQKELAYLMRLLSRAHQETKTWYIEPLPLELAVVDYCGHKSV